jgi:hypothetical protein
MIGTQDSEALRKFAEAVDQLCGIEITGRGVVGGLYAAARARQGEPLAMRAARLLKGAVRGPGDVVLIATGLPTFAWFLTEQDGPVGAATLARALVLAYGVKPVIVTNPGDEGICRAAVTAAGLYCLPLERAMQLPTTAAVVPFPADPEEAERAALELVARTRPRALVAIERPGANEKGHYHSASGRRFTEHCGKVEALLPHLRRAGAPIVGIGDGGNELGCSMIREAVVAEVPGAATCRCGCGGSVVPAAEVDALVIAAISNWGAYGIEACLAALEQRAEILHSPEVDTRVHSLTAAAMANNDGPGLLDPGTDAVPARVHASFVDVLGWMVGAAGLDPGRLYRHPRYPWLYDPEVGPRG